MGRQQLHGQAAGQDKIDRQIDRYRWLGVITRATTRVPHGSSMLGSSQPLSIYLQAKERALLHAYYGPHNQELYTLIGRDMGWEQMASADAGRS